MDSHNEGKKQKSWHFMGQLGLNICLFNKTDVHINILLNLQANMQASARLKEDTVYFTTVCVTLDPEK